MKKIELIAFLSLSIALIAFLIISFALGASSNLSQRNWGIADPPSYPSPFDIAELQGLMNTYEFEASKLGLAVLKELVFSLPEAERVEFIRSRNPIMSNESLAQQPFTVCLRTDLLKEEIEKVSSIFMELFGFHLRTEDQGGEPFYFLTRYDECDWGISISQSDNSQAGTVELTSFVWTRTECAGWNVVYPSDISWINVPSLTRQRILIC